MAKWSLFQLLQKNGGTLFKTPLYLRKGRMVMLEDRKLLFSTVPKVANNSIKLAVQHTLTGEPLPDEIRYIVAYSNSTPSYQGDKKGLQALLDQGWKCIGFVRNPWSRLVSCWFDKFQRGVTPSGIKMGSRYGWPEEMSFEDFVWRVTDIPHYQADAHFAPCHLFHEDWPVIRYEQLDTEWPKLMERFSLISLPHYRKRTQGDYRKMFNDKLADAVAKYYETDCARFGYDFDGVKPD